MYIKYEFNKWWKYHSATLVQLIIDVIYHGVFLKNILYILGKHFDLVPPKDWN